MANASYKDRLAETERYLSKAETLLESRKHGRRLNALLVMAADELRRINGEINLELTRRDAAGEDADELDDLSIWLYSLESKRERLLVQAGERFGLDADRLIGSHSPELVKLALRVNAAKQETASPTTGDGKQAADDRLWPAKQIRDLLPEHFPSWKVQRAFLESHPEVTAERRGQHWFIDLHQLVSAKLKDQTGEITDKAIDTYLDGVKERKAEIDAKRNRQRK